MAKGLSRRSAMKLGGGLLAASTLSPWEAFAATSINYWHTFTSQSEFAGLDDILALFAKAHPDITINPEAIPNPEFMAKITAAVVSGSRPNVTALSSERFQDLRAMGALLDITDRIASWERRGDFDDARFASITHEGRVYGVPAFSFVDWIYYRKDWFDAAGIAVPTTLAEFRDAAIKLTDASAGRYGFGLRGGPGGQNIVINMMEAFGASLMHEDGSISLDREKAIAGIDFWAGLMFRDKAVPPSAPNDGFRQIIEGFQTGQTAMIYHHTGSFQDIASKLEAGRAVRHDADPVGAGQAGRAARLRLSRDHQRGQSRRLVGMGQVLGRARRRRGIPRKDGLLPGLERRGKGRAHRRQSALRVRGRNLGLRHPAAELPGFCRLGRRHRAPGIPARADRRRRPPNRRSTR